MKNPRHKITDRPRKTSGNKVAPLSTRTENRKAGRVHPGRVHRTPDGTIEESTEEAAP